MSSSKPNMSTSGELHEPSPDIMRPTLLPSALSKDSTRSLSPHAEGYEGAKLHEIYMAAQRRNAGIVHEELETGAADDDKQPFPAASTDIKPFFAVIEDETTGEQHHPHVYYIFSDDDQELTTKAALRTLNPQNLGEGASEQLPQPEEERNIIIDMTADGQSIAFARSLSSSWQLSSYSVGTAPTFDDKAQQGQGGMMLRLSGMTYSAAQESQNSGPMSASSHEGGNEKLMSQIEGLSRQFEDDMATLKRLATPE